MDTYDHSVTAPTNTDNKCASRNHLVTANMMDTDTDNDTAQLTGDDNTDNQLLPRTTTTANTDTNKKYRPQHQPQHRPHYQNNF
mmetsp:Transcript_5363/g.11284  ORF Transcript_5363/g.11284 Transcript_5363/m.11284 type:complete len:84 (+) Transcript_5363:859-1110(+)